MELYKGTTRGIYFAQKLTDLLRPWGVMPELGDNPGDANELLCIAVERLLSELTACKTELESVDAYLTEEEIL